MYIWNLLKFETTFSNLLSLVFAELPSFRYKISFGWRNILNQKKNTAEQQYSTSSNGKFYWMQNLQSTQFRFDKLQLSYFSHGTTKLKIVIFMKCHIKSFSSQCWLQLKEDRWDMSWTYIPWLSCHLLFCRSFCCIFNFFVGCLLTPWENGRVYCIAPLLENN